MSGSDDKGEARPNMKPELFLFRPDMDPEKFQHAIWRRSAEAGHMPPKGHPAEAYLASLNLLPKDAADAAAGEKGEGSGNDGSPRADV